ncbi:MAG: hypothetical protein Q9O24_01145 [Gammaproteobacteria bacterium]|nr:hypothetical protein [Gammaproteobacteria bacterium]
MTLLQCSVAALLITASGVSLAAKEASSPFVIAQSQQESELKTLFYQVWQHLSSYNPRKRDRSSTTVTAVTGTRGAQSTVSIMQPVWKQDLSSDNQFVAQQQSLNRVQRLVEAQRLQQAKQVLQSFMHDYPNGELLPNATFALGLVYAGLGQSKESRQQLQRFISTTPKHPLVADARQVISAL